MTTTASPIDRLRELGGALFLEGDRLRYCIPAGHPEARQVVAELRSNRDAIVSMLRDIESQAPSLEEVLANLPPGVRVLSYEPRAVPFEVAQVSIVTNAGRFFRAYLADLACRLERPTTHAAPLLQDILGKLADAGLTLVVDGTESR